MDSRGLFLCIAAVAGALAMFGAPSVRAADVIAEWDGIKAPPAPELKAVTVDPKTTAAPAAGAPVFYTFSGTAKPADIADPGIAPREGEVVAVRGPDKFLGSE